VRLGAVARPAIQLGDRGPGRKLSSGGTVCDQSDPAPARCSARCAGCSCAPDRHDRVSWPLLARAKPQACLNMGGCALNSKPATAGTFHHTSEAGSREWRATFGREYERRLGILLPGKPTQCAEFVLLGPADGQRRVFEVDLVPAQVDQFNRPEAVPVGQQHHGGVAVAVSIGLGGLRTGSGDTSLRCDFAKPHLRTVSKG